MKKILFLLLLLSNCVILNLSRTEKLIKKDVVSTKEFVTKEEELKFIGKKNISQESVSIQFERYLRTKKNKEIVYSSKFLITEELTDSFYIIGGIIPFVVEEHGWKNYFSWAWILFPVAIVDWLTIPFRTGTHEETKSETEKIVLQEEVTSVKDNSTLKVLINETEIPHKNNVLQIPLNVIIKNKRFSTSNQFEKYKMVNYSLEYELINQNFNNEKTNIIELTLDKVFTEKEYNTILLLEAKNDPEQYQDVIFYFIDKINSKKEDIKLIDQLLKSGIKLNYSNHFENSPLSYACSIGNLEIVKYLIERGANVNYHGEANDSYLPLNQAILIGNFDLVKYLIEKGADVNYGNENFAPPLHLAVDNPYLGNKSPNLEIIKLLVERGANLNSLDFQKKTPLQRAEGKPQIMEYLESKGAK